MVSFRVRPPGPGRRSRRAVTFLVPRCRSPSERRSCCRTRIGFGHFLAQLDIYNVKVTETLGSGLCILIIARIINKIQDAGMYNLMTAQKNQPSFQTIRHSNCSLETLLCVCVDRLSQEASSHEAAAGSFWTRRTSMRRRYWYFATLVTLLFTGYILPMSNRSTAPRSVVHRPGEVRGPIKDQDPLASEAAARWRNCQPHHWRACLLRR